MKTVFLSGSRNLSRLNEEVRRRLDNMMQNELAIMTGDANGADRAMQAYLASHNYSKVTIYFVGEQPRNNVGSWKTKHVVGTEGLSGRDFYAQKDHEMSMIADYGLVLWDGKSSGSVQNMIWLLAAKKPVVVYVAPEKEFFNLRTDGELVEVLSRRSDEVLDDIGRKIELPSELNRRNRRQGALRFHPS